MSALARGALLIGAASVSTIGLAGPIATDPSSLIDVQFGENNYVPATQQYVGAAAFGGSSDRWNLISGPALIGGVGGSNIPLRNASGTSTGVTLSYDSPGSFYNAIGDGGIFAAAPERALMTSYLYAQSFGAGAPGQVTVSGLTPNAYYQVLPYSAAEYAGRGTTFTVGGVQQTVTPTAAPTLALGKTFGEFVAHADANGSIALTMTAAGTSSFAEANLDGLQIVPIPVVAAHNLVNVQFGSAASATARYVGPGVVSSVGNDRWNLITEATAAGSVALVDAAGSPTGISLSHSAMYFFDVGDDGIMAGTPEESLLTSYAFAGKPPVQFTLSGLNAGASYELILDSVADAIGRGTAFEVGGVTQVVSPSGAQVQGLGDSFTEFLATADSAGDILFTMAPFGSGGVLGFPEANLNGIQLIALPTSVPEPPTVLIFSVGLMGLTWVRRRKTRGIRRFGW